MSLRMKLTLSFVLFGTLITGILTVLIFSSTRAQMRSDFRQRLLDIVGVGALSIDAGTLDGLHVPQQEGSPGYRKVKAVLKRIKANADDIHFVYTMRATDGGEIMFVVDETDDPKEIAHLGDIYTDASPFLKEHFIGMDTPMVETDFYTDRWGTWLTGYAPVVDDAGKRVGVLGVDIKAGRILSYENQLITVFISLFAVSIIISALLGGYLGKRLSDPILILKARAERIGMGDFTTVIPVHTRDELGVLATAFNMMSAKLDELVGTLQREISQREAAEKKYRSIFENAMEGMFQSTHDGRLLTANPAFSSMLGYDSPEEAIGAMTDVARQLYAESDQRREILAILDADGRVNGHRVKMVKKDGGTIWTELTARMVTENGQDPFIEGLLKDISETLARETAEREQQMAEAASLAKSEFLANMSHEIRTPMNAIMGLTHLALKTDLTARQADYMKKILNAANSLLRIINDILDFSKIEAGKLSIETVPFEMASVMGNLADIHGIKSEEKGLELLFQLDPEVPLTLRGDPLRLEQVLTNLVSNAIKFTDKGNIVVAIHNDAVGENSGEDEVRLRFAVKDSGMGLSEEQQKRLFSSFSQADQSITRKFGGTGLGLSICKRLVALMGGDIRVDSAPGVGSTFTFTATFGMPSAEAPKALTYPSDLKGLKVLVVDDNGTARQIICEMLESFTFNADPSPSGAEALHDLVKAQEAGAPYRLVIMDWKMPGMDGIQAAEAIRHDARLPDKPAILMLTAYSQENIQEHAIRAGIDGFLIKPVNPSLLFDAIMSVFYETSERQAIRTAREKSQVDGLDRIRGANILLVEDYEINRQIATELLESEGFRVEAAANGRLAIERMAQADAAPAIDLVLMDIQMPEMDGYTATRKIRALPTDAARVPIVAMTAHALETEKKKCFEAGMDDHIAKPIDPARLIEALVAWIAPGQQAPVEKKARDADGPPAIALDPAVFNLEAGLSRVAGNKKLYFDLLKKFSEKYKDAVETIRGCLSRNDVDTGRALSHAIKGMSGNLGAEALQNVAGRLEAAFAAGHTEACMGLMPDFEGALARVIDDIAGAEPVDAGGKEPACEGIDTARVRSLAEELKALVSSDFGLALQKAETLKTAPLPAGAVSLVETALFHLEAFEENEAGEALDRLIHELNGECADE